MIDFRYHLVSLISVFLALAVGIVLGAGPLRESLGDQLAGQVEQLRTEQEQLRGESEDLTAQRDELASFITDIGPDLVAGSLDGTRVAVLTDSTTTRDSVDRMVSLLSDAGAASTVRVELQSTLWEPGRDQDRADALAAALEIAPDLPGEADGSELTDGQRLAALVPVLLAGEAGTADGQAGTGSAPGTEGDPGNGTQNGTDSGTENGADTGAGTGSALTAEQRAQLWQVLIDHRMVSLDGAAPEAVDAVVVASAAPAALAVDTDDDQTATERDQALLAARTSLLGALTTTGLPAVVSAATPGNDASTGILRTVRGDRAYDGLSTTDRLQESDGPLLAVLALVEQTRGGAGAYGTTADAADRLPSLPETSGLQEEAGTGSTTDGGTTDGGASDGGGEG